MKRMIYVALSMLVGVLAAEARLSVKLDEPKRTGEKSLIKATLKNTFAEKVESARATLFLLDENGKPVQQMTRWVIGGAKEQPRLASGASTTYNFVVTTEKPFATTKLVFSRIVLEGGSLANPVKDLQMEEYSSAAISCDAVKFSSELPPPPRQAVREK